MCLHLGHLLRPFTIPGSSWCSLQTSMVVKLPRIAPAVMVMRRWNISIIERIIDGELNW